MINKKIILEDCQQLLNEKITYDIEDLNKYLDRLIKIQSQIGPQKLSKSNIGVKSVFRELIDDKDSPLFISGGSVKCECINSNWFDDLVSGKLQISLDYQKLDEQSAVKCNNINAFDLYYYFFEKRIDYLNSYLKKHCECDE